MCDHDLKADKWKVNWAAGGVTWVAVVQFMNTKTGLVCAPSQRK